MTHWVRFRTVDEDMGFGTLVDGEILEHQGDMFGVTRSTGRTLNSKACVLQSPCTPSKIVGLWNNFHALAAKLGKAAPAHPLWFTKPDTSVIGPEESIRRPPEYTGKIVFEGELGIVIGKTCRRISALDAGRHIFGYTCVNDVTAADLLYESADFAQWARAKSFDTFSCIGPAIATDLDISTATLLTQLDGNERQNYPLSDMIFKPAELVSRLSHDLTLLPGDVIACGTSLGVGSIKAGNNVEITISGVGTLANTLTAV
jgi:2-keto-4-pentenoate hydratase/2-oxohepta-3-ene-1,7-dioic acid hydratase in catechol pathway